MKEINRRNFLTSLASIPVVGILAQETIFSPKKLNAEPLLKKVVRIERDSYTIFTPGKIKELGYIYVPTPIFEYHGNSYCVKTYMLKTHLDHDTFLGDINKWLPEVQYLAGAEIKKLKLTHIYSVLLNKSPFVDPKTYKCWDPILVRGARAK